MDCSVCGSCAFCYARYVSPVIDEAHKNGSAHLQISATVDDPLIQQNGSKLTSLAFPLLESASAGHEINVPLALQAGLERFLKRKKYPVRYTDHKLVPRKDTVADRLSRSGAQGLDLIAMSPSDRKEMEALLKNNLAFTLPNTSLVFSSKLIGSGSAYAPVFLHAVLP